MQVIKIKVNFFFIFFSNMFLYLKDKNLRNGLLGQVNGFGVQDFIFDRDGIGFYR